MNRYVMAMIVVCLQQGLPGYLQDDRPKPQRYRVTVLLIVLESAGRSLVHQVDGVSQLPLPMRQVQWKDAEWTVRWTPAREQWWA